MANPSNGFGINPSTNNGGGFGKLEGNSNYLTTSFRIDAYAKAVEDFKEAAIDRYGVEQNGIKALVDAIGGSRDVTSIKYGHAETDFLRKNVTITIAGEASVTKDASVTNAQKWTAPDPETATFYLEPKISKAIPLRVNDIVEVGGVRAIVTAVTVPANTDVATVALQSTSTATLSAGTYTVSPITNSYAEGSGHGKSKDRDLLRYENFIQIVKDQYEVTGTEAAQISFISVKGRDYWYVNGIEDTKRRMNIDIENTLLIGEKLTSTNAAFENKSMTEGLIPFMENYGLEQTFTTKMDLTALDAGIKQLRKFRGSNVNALVGGHDRLVELQDMIRGLGGLQNGGVGYGEAGKLIDIGFDGFKRAGYTFMFNTLFAFDDFLGVGNTKYADYLLSIPMGGDVFTTFDYGRETSEKRTYISTVTQSAPGEVNGYKEWVMGSILGASNTENDSARILMRQRIGFEGHCPNKFLLFTKEA